MGLKTKLSNSAEIVRQLWFLARPYGILKPLLLLLVILLQGVLQVAGVASIFPFLAVAADPSAFRQSRIGGELLGQLSPMSNEQVLIVVGVVSILALVVSNAANLISDYFRGLYAHGLGNWLRLRLLTQIANQPWSYFLQQNTGILLKKTSTDVNQLVTGVLLPLLEGISRLATALLLILALLLVDTKVALGAATVLLVYYVLVFRILQEKQHRTSVEWKEANRGLVRDAQQLLGGIKTIKTFQAERYFLDRFAHHSYQHAKVNSRLPLFYHAPKYVLEPIAFGTIIAVVCAYILEGQKFDHLLPTLGLLGLAGYRLLPAVQLLYAQVSQIATMRHTLEEVYDEFGGRARSDVPVVFTRPTDRLIWSSDIRLQNVSFFYDQTAEPILKDVSLTIRKGSSLGITGRTGAGKSTLVDILVGLLPPSSGVVLVDGVQLTDDQQRAWQAGIAYVSQDIFLTDDTIARNIAFGLPDDQVDWERIREAAQEAQILEFIIDDLPDGFDTVVGERGVRLSGGQRQRIALARALYRRPDLLILDEATSALDEKTESDVASALHRLHGRITIVAIAHRRATIEKCDQVFALGDGGQPNAVSLGKPIA